jgi:dolichol kinase
MKRELSRKAFHVASVVLPLLAWLAPRPLAVAVLVPTAAVALAVDVARLRLRWPRYHFLRLTRTLLRPHERRGLAGATYMAVAYAAALLCFPKPLAVAAMLYNGLGDAAAALVGKRWGRHRTAWGKSWEGFAAALAVNLGAGLAIGALDPRFPLAGVVAGAVAAAALEMAPLPLDDNLRVTLGGGAAAWLASALVWGALAPPG